MSTNVKQKNLNTNNSQPQFQGSIWKNLIVISIPVAIYLIFKHFTSAVDYFIVGNPTKINKNIDSVITLMKQIGKVFQAIAMGLGGAGVILVAQEYKKNNKEKTQEYVTLAFLFSIILSLLLSIVFYIGAIIPNFDLFLPVSYRTDGGSLCYNIQLISFIFMTINVVFIGIERAKNKTCFVFFLNILNISTRVLLAFGYKWFREKGNVSIVDLQFATLFSDLLITFIAFYFMFFNKKNDTRLDFKKFKFSSKVLKKFSKLSGGLVVGKATYEVGKAVVNILTTKFYEPYEPSLLGIAGLAALVNGIVYSLSQSFEDGQSVMVSQESSNQDSRKTLKIFKNVFVITTILGTVGILVNQFYGEKLLRFFKPTKDFSSEEIQGFKTILFYEQLSLFTSVWASMMMGYIISYNKSAKVSFWMNLLRVSLRISLLSLLFLATDINHYSQFGWSTAGSNIIVLIVVTVIFVKFIKKSHNESAQQKIIKKDLKKKVFLV
ncbi:Na+-driven multidrug efflux pump [Candidatus Phytoplasma pruni]|uniref:Na+-driven multidrug efflux pump n=1 Tax=Candidatus Phytoplasma pruni TaxID=479893 RepID=A0A0M1MZN2_9MOLU|nr:MATE family efflux transporter [Candidatus Phytoplasma pruni]KOR75347.1 Na+-driven multidrug efflux pump [Candidatus Phytoplasma pruni]